MRQATRETEIVIDESLDVYIKQEKAVKLTEVKFQDITQNMSAIMDEIDRASEVLKGLYMIQTDVNDAVTRSVLISETAAAVIEELLASGEEQRDSVEILVSMSSSLNDSISEINDELSRFIVE
jgi:methyl-accepting chemotaxis protein